MGLSVISSLPNGISSAASTPINRLAEGLPGEFAALLSGARPDSTETLSQLIQTTPNQARLEKYPRLAAEDIPAETINLIDPSMLTALAGKEALGQANIPARGTVGLQAAADTLHDAVMSEVKTLSAGSSILAAEILTPQSSEQPSITPLEGQIGQIMNVPALQPEIAARGSVVGSTGTESIEKHTPALLNTFGTNLERSEARLVQPTRTDDLGTFEKLLPGGPRTTPSGTPGNETAKFAGEIKALETPSPTQTTNPLANPLSKPSQADSSINQASIHTHLREGSWPQQFGEKVVWLAKNDQQSARININPPELGPVQITLSLNGDQAKVAFSSPHVEVRQAIENAMPQLKEMLSSAGINLGQSDVGANLSQQTPDHPYQTANGKHLADENAILPANDKALNTSSSSILLRGRGLVDLFA